MLTSHALNSEWTLWKAVVIFLSRRWCTSSRSPVEIRPVLHLLEVGDGHTAGVGQEVGDDEAVLLAEDAVALRCRRSVRELATDLRVDVGSVLLRDDVLERGREDDVHRQLEEIRVADRGGRGSPGPIPSPACTTTMAGASRPSGQWIPPLESETATSLLSSPRISFINVAANWPALPKPGPRRCSRSAACREP